MEQFTYVRRGYDPQEVDNYVATLESVIKSYKEKDNAIKNAIISAQVAADNMIKNAKLQADEYKAQIVRELEKVREEVANERANMMEFQNLYGNLIRKYLLKLDESEISEMHTRLNEIDRLIDHLMDNDALPGGMGVGTVPMVDFKVPLRTPRTSRNTPPPIVDGDDENEED